MRSWPYGNSTPVPGSARHWPVEVSVLDLDFVGPLPDRMIIPPWDGVRRVSRWLNDLVPPVCPKSGCRAATVAIMARACSQAICIDS